MSKATMKVVLVSMLAVSCLTGCAMFNKGTMHYTRTTTIGKELVDLQEAKEKGVLTDEEFAKAKKDILQGGPMMVDAPCSKDK